MAICKNKGRFETLFVLCYNSQQRLLAASNVSWCIAFQYVKKGRQYLPLHLSQACTQLLISPLYVQVSIGPSNSVGYCINFNKCHLYDASWWCR